MDRLLGSKSLPPGFRFHPTDEELFMYYLKRKVQGKPLRPHTIAEVDVYRFDPWDLPSKSCLKSRDVLWYFFCPRSKKYANGARTNRSTEHGYWKSTGNDRTVKYKNRPVGKIKTLIFHQGKAPNGDRTDWVMHEYRLEDQDLVNQGVAQDAFVISKVYKKSGLGPKNGEHYGAPFVEEEWGSDDDDNDDNLETASGLVLHPEGSGGVAVIQNTPSSAAPAVTPSAAAAPTGIPLSTAIATAIPSSATGVATPSSATGVATLSSATGVATPSSATGAATPSSATGTAATPSAVVEDDDELENLLAMFGDEEVCPLDKICPSDIHPSDDIFTDLGDFMELNDLKDFI